MSGKLHFGAWELDLNSGELSRDTVKTGALRNRSAKVLELLIVNEGDVVTKEDLICHVWEGRATSDDSLVQCIADIRRVLGSDRDLLDTVAKRGYRLLRPTLKSYETQASKAALVDFTPAEVEDAVRILLLPFRNASDDPMLDYFAEGITLDLRDALTKRGQFIVFEHADSPDEEAFTAARARNARHILSGVVRQGEDRIDTVATLRRVEDGCTIWTDRPEVDADPSFFRLQENTSVKIVRAVSARLDRELEGWGLIPLSGQVCSLRAWKLLAEAAQHANVQLCRKRRRIARALYDEALSIDPGCVGALAGLALIAWMEFRYCGDQSAIEDAETFSGRALDIGPDDPAALIAQGIVHSGRNNAIAIQSARRAVEITRNEPQTLLNSTYILLRSGEVDEAHEMLVLAESLDPARFEHAPSEFKTQVLMQLGRYEEASDYLDRFLADTSGMFPFFVLHAIIAHILNQHNRAAELYDRAMALFPDHDGFIYADNLTGTDKAHLAVRAAASKALHKDWMVRNGRFTIEETEASAQVP